MDWPRTKKFLEKNKDKRPTFRTTVDLDEAAYKSLRVFCKTKSIRVGDLLSEMILDFIDQNQAEITESIVLKSGSKD